MDKKKFEKKFDWDSSELLLLWTENPSLLNMDIFQCENQRFKQQVKVNLFFYQGNGNISINFWAKEKMQTNFNANEGEKKINKYLLWSFNWNEKLEQVYVLCIKNLLKLTLNILNQQLCASDSLAHVWVWVCVCMCWLLHMYINLLYFILFFVQLQHFLFK